VPSLHQDHRAVYEAGLTATRPHPESPVEFVALYEYTLSAVAPIPYPAEDRGVLIVDISGAPLETKLAALARHSSQMTSRPRNHSLHPDSVRKLAAFRGLAAGVDAAEWLYPLRIVL
jgi:LmbE family N-acetylglucosaminyl deacetylase